MGAEAIARLAGVPPGRRIWRPIGLDAEGLDLAAGGMTARVDFFSPALEPDAWRERLREKIAASAAS